MNRTQWGKWAEMTWPWIFAGAAAAFCLALNQRIHLAEEVKLRLLDKLVDVCAISVGFWSTALALLLALDERKTVEGLRKLGIYNRIVGYFLTTVYSFFALLLSCLATIAIGRPPLIPHNVYATFWAFILTFSTATMLRSFWVLGKLLKSA